MLRAAEKQNCHLERSYKVKSSKEPVSAVDRMKIFVPTVSPLGESYFYPVFEYTPPPSTSICSDLNERGGEIKYMELTNKFLAIYSNDMSAVLINHKQCENKILAHLCNECPFRSCKWSCDETISRGHFLQFRLKRSYLLGQTKPRSKRSDANSDKQTKHITVHDVRFLGHPTVVDLEYVYSRNKTQTEKLRNLPGLSQRSGWNQTRFTKRLVAAINTGLAHSFSAEYISEATAVSFHTVKSWKKEAYHSASNVIRDTSPKTCFMLADFSSVSLCQNFSLAGNVDRYGKKYTFVIRTESDSSYGDTQLASPRLTGIYPTSDWNIVGRLCRGEAFNYDLSTDYLTDGELPYHVMSNFFPGPKQISRLSPKKLFTIAFDYLSDVSNNILCKPGAASPVLGALLLAALHPRWKKYILDPEHNAWAPQVLRRFYTLLMDTVGHYHCRDLPDMLSALEDNTLPVNASDLVQSVREWRILCEEAALMEGFTLPHCLPEFNAPESNVPESAQETIYLDFPLESGIESMQELITALLLLNPATLSTVYTEWNGNSLFGRYQLSYEHPAMLENGEFDFDRIVPGIDMDQLVSLLEQGFLRESRISYFKKTT